MLNLTDFDYHLPGELVAQTPLEGRDHSRLCVHKKNGMTVDACFSDLPSFLPKNSLIVVNDTKVFPSRLFGNLYSGGKVELFLLTLPKISKNQDGCIGSCLGKPMKKLRIGTKIYFEDSLEAVVLERIETPSGPRLSVSFNCSLKDLLNWCHNNAKAPIPPYIRRKEKDPLDKIDKERYQTIYAMTQGSVAAPTAGLHFTDEIISRLKSNSIDFASITLHVGAGTFMPVKTEDITKHNMHKEIFSISDQTLKKIVTTRESGGKVLVVGTTVLRAIESLGKLADREFAQASELCDTWLETDLFVKPKSRTEIYVPWLIDGLITNFHQPKSTLFMLICSLIGFDKAHYHYERAIKEKYRFLSYGDSNLFWLS